MQKIEYSIVLAEGINGTESPDAKGVKVTEYCCSADVMLHEYGSLSLAKKVIVQCSEKGIKRIAESKSAKIRDDLKLMLGFEIKEQMQRRCVGASFYGLEVTDVKTYNLSLDQIEALAGKPNSTSNVKKTT